MSNKVKQKNILNRRAHFDYELGDELTVGLCLTGKKVRSIRDGRTQLKGAFVTINKGELWLNNASFTLKINQKGGMEQTVDTTPVKLLATKQQIRELEKQRTAGLQLVPIKILNSGRYLKLVMSTGKSKKVRDKRQVIKKRDTEREINRELKNR